jgi:hypothetical protein
LELGSEISGVSFMKGPHASGAKDVVATGSDMLPDGAALVHFPGGAEET